MGLQSSPWLGFNADVGVWRGEGVPEDKQKAISFYQASASQGYGLALYKLGQIYFSGYIVPKDEKKAASYWEMGAQNEHIESLVQIGACCFLGRGKQKDLNKGLNYWISAANLGDATAQMNLGKIYLGGHGIKADLEESRHWLSLANIKGFEGAAALLKEIQEIEQKIIPFTKKVSNDRTWLETMVKNFENAPPELKLEFLEAVKPSDHIFSTPIMTLLETDETREIEFKETFFVPTKTEYAGQVIQASQIKYAALREIAGFLNSRDGTLLIGIADGKNTETGCPEVKGIEFDNFSNDRDKYALRIMNVIRPAFGDATADLVEISFDIIDAKTICRIDCSKSSDGVYLNFKGNTEKAFIRIGTETIEPSAKQWAKWINDNFNL